MSGGQDSWHGGRPTPYPPGGTGLLVLTLSCSLPPPWGGPSSDQFGSVHPGWRLPKGPERPAPVASRGWPPLPALDPILPGGCFNRVEWPAGSENDAPVPRDHVSALKDED